MRDQALQRDQALLRDQALQRDQAQQCSSEAPDASKEVDKQLDSLRLKLQAAQEDLESTRASLTAAEKAAVDAEKALHRLAASFSSWVLMHELDMHHSLLCANKHEESEVSAPGQWSLCALCVCTSAGLHIAK